MHTPRSRQTRRRRARVFGLLGTVAIGAGVVGSTLVGASSAGSSPTVDELHARGCVPSFSLLTDRADGPTRKTVKNLGSGSCAGVEIWVSHDDRDGNPDVYGKYVLNADGGEIEVDPSHALCAKRTRRDGNRVIDDPNGDVQWDAFTGDPTLFAPREHNGKLLTAAWLPYPGCPPPPPPPTTAPPTTQPPPPPTTAPPTTTTEPPAPAPTTPPAPPTTHPGCPPGQVGPPAPGCPPDVPPTVPTAPTAPPWEPPPVTSPTFPGTPPCPPVGPPGGPGNPSCPPQGAYQP